MGAPSDDDGFSDSGAVHVLFLGSDGTVVAEQKISAAQGALTTPLDAADGFGHSVAGVGDLDGDGVVELAVTATFDDDGVTDGGSVHILSLAGYTNSDFDGLWDHLEDDNADGDNDPATNPGPDTDTDGLADYLDIDDDGDGVPTFAENPDPERRW